MDDADDATLAIGVLIATERDDVVFEDTTNVTHPIIFKGTML